MLKASLAACSISVAIAWSYVRHVQLPMGPSRLQWGGTVFGHRGCCNVPGIPENTLDAYKYAVSRGAGGIACDVRLTKDNEVIIFHDAVVKRHLCGVSPKARIDELTLFELKGCTFSGDPTGQIRVPTLEESVLFCRENNLRMLIDIKEMQRARLCVDKVLDLYRRYPDYMYEQATIISFNPRVLYRARVKDKHIATGQIYSGTILQKTLESGTEQLPGYVRVCPSFFDAVLVFVQEKISPWAAGCSMVCPSYHLYDEKLRRRWHSRKIAVNLWGMLDSAACPHEIRTPGVLLTVGDKHEEFATPKQAPDFDIFGDRQRERERAEDEQRRQLRLKS